MSKAADALGHFTGEDYEVLARSRRGDPLVHIGGVRAPSERLARTYALLTYDEELWAELAVVPRRSIGWARSLSARTEEPKGAGVQ